MKDLGRERDEAVRAADIALDHLYRAHDLLGSAGRWGMFDILAGGFITSLVKRSKMSDAEAELNAARDALRVFARELSDVEGAGGIHVETGTLSGAFDLFFDNPFVDLYVQGQINEAKDGVEQAIDQVERIRDLLVDGPRG